MTAALARATLARGFELAGTGVHSGAACRVELEPAPWGVGIALDTPAGAIPATVEHARAVPGATVLRRGGAAVGTAEHLLAALVGIGITDAVVRVEGPEIPILDGSARPWVEALLGAGVASGPDRVPPRLVAARVERGGAWATLEPGLRGLRVEVDFDDPGLPRGIFELDPVPGAFAEQVAWARTFALERDVAALRAAGRGAGASAENTVVFGASGPSVPLRSPDEAVRHKLLDLIGDLALLGALPLARVVVHRGSHALHLELLRAALSPA